MIFDKINDLLDELKREKFVLVKNELGDPIKENNYKMVENELGLKLKRLFHNLFGIHRSIEIFYKNADDSIVGECSIEGLKYSFNEYAQELYIQIYDEWGEEFKTFARQFYPLDIYRESLDAVTLTVVKIIDEEHLEIWIWNNAGPKYKLKFNSIEEYLEAGVKCKFIICWQYFYIDTEALDFNDPFTKEWIASDFFDAVSRMKTALGSMKEYFPEEDWSYQEGEMERVKLLEKR